LPRRPSTFRQRNQRGRAVVRSIGGGIFHGISGNDFLLLSAGDHRPPQVVAFVVVIGIDAAVRDPGACASGATDNT
jgi:hypothetical protein